MRRPILVWCSYWIRCLLGLSRFARKTIMWNGLIPMRSWFLPRKMGSLTRKNYVKSSMLVWIRTASMRILQASATLWMWITARGSFTFSMPLRSTRRRQIWLAAVLLSGLSLWTIMMSWKIACRTPRSVRSIVFWPSLYLSLPMSIPFTTVGELWTASTSLRIIPFWRAWLRASSLWLISFVRKPSGWICPWLSVSVWPTGRDSTSRLVSWPCKISIWQRSAEVTRWWSRKMTRASSPFSLAVALPLLWSGPGPVLGLWLQPFRIN